MAIEIVELPIESMAISHSYLNLPEGVVFKDVYKGIYRGINSHGISLHGIGSNDHRKNNTAKIRASHGKP